MPTFPTMPLIMPTVGGSSGSWGTLLASAFLVLDGHQHLGVGSGGAQIVSAAININADLTFASYSATNLRSATFAAGQAVSGVRKLYVGANSELYWNNSAAGAAIQLTSGTSLNVSAFIGGIGGDYTSVSAALNYDNSAARYTLKAGGGTTWARVAAGEVRIHEHASTSSIYVALAAPAGIASPYTVTFPAAVPGSTLLVQVSSAGVMTFSNTVVNAVTFSGAITPTGGIAAATFTGLITASAGITVSAGAATFAVAVTANAGVTCASNQHVTVSGTGEYKHGDKTIAQSGGGVIAVSSGTYGAGVSSDAPYWQLSTGGGIVYLQIQGIRTGDRVKSLKIVGLATQEPTLAIYTQAAGVSTVRAHTAANTIVTNGDTTLTLNAAYTLSSEHVWLKITSGASTFDVRQIVCTYDRP
jgi:hypothetical protein